MKKNPISKSVLWASALGTLCLSAAVAPSYAIEAASLPAPKLVKMVPPEYPRAAERRNIEGKVTVQFNILADGLVAEVSVVQADKPGIFDKAAMEAVKKWKFEQDQPRESITKVINFKLAG